MREKSHKLTSTKVASVSTFITIPSHICSFYHKKKYFSFSNFFISFFYFVQQKGMKKLFSIFGTSLCCWGRYTTIHDDDVCLVEPKSNDKKKRKIRKFLQKTSWSPCAGRGAQQRVSKLHLLIFFFCVFSFFFYVRLGRWKILVRSQFWQAKGRVESPWKLFNLFESD